MNISCLIFGHKWIKLNPFWYKCTKCKKLKNDDVLFRETIDKLKNK